MLQNYATPQILFIALGSIGLYLLILAVVFGKKILLNWTKGFRQPALQSASAGPAQQILWSKHDLLPPLIDKPADHPSEQAGLYHDLEDPYYEVEGDGQVTLLKSAEYVVEQIQTIIDNIASFPANPDEVFSKVRAVVSEYSFFLDTEYYDAINNFVAVTVKRDCDLDLTEDDLKSLWLAQAA